MYLSPISFWATPWTVARQAPLSMGFSRQEYWSGVTCPPPGDLPDPGIEPMSLPSPAFAGRFFTMSTPWETLDLLSFTQLSSYLTIINLSIHICNLSSTHTRVYIYISIIYVSFVLSIIIYPSSVYLPSHHLYIYLGGSHRKESACNVGDLGSVPGLVSSPGEGNGNTVQYSCLENPMDRGAWWAIYYMGLHNLATDQKQE